MHIIYVSGYNGTSVNALGLLDLSLLWRFLYHGGQKYTKCQKELKNIPQADVKLRYGLLFALHIDNVHALNNRGHASRTIIFD